MKVNRDIEYIKSFTDAFLHEVGFTRNEEAGCVVYELAERGSIVLRPLGEYQTEISFIDPAQPILTGDLAKARQLKKDGIISIPEELEVLLEDAERMYEERRAFIQNLQNEFWARLRRELSTLALVTKHPPLYKEVELPTTKENIFDLLDYYLTRVFPATFQFWYAETYINGELEAYKEEECHESNKYLMLYELTHQPNGAIVKGAVLKSRWTPEHPLEDEVIETLWVFFFNFIQLEANRMRLRVRYDQPFLLENNEVLLADASSIWEYLWERINSDYGLNEDGTPASKNEGGTPAGKREKGNGVDVEFRYEIFRKIKEAHPEYTLLNVAEYANENFYEDLGKYVNGDTVKNAFRLTGHKWKRGKRAR